MRPIVVATLGLAALSLVPAWMVAGCGSGNTQQAAGTTAGTGGGGASSGTGAAGGGATTSSGGNTGGANTGGATTGTGGVGTGGMTGSGGTGGGACVPSMELCDGIDNNCDGVVDENCGCKNGDTKSCYSGDPATLGIGECHGGTQTCDLMGVWGACVGEVTPTAEVCDGLDNDCNGTKDEGLGKTTCGFGICQVTVDNCVNGAPQTCTPTAPEVEKCDGLDNNCDGTIDEGCSCIDGTQQPCYTGPMATMNVGECKPGTQICQGGQWGACENQIVPTAETCNAKDDDCNGQVDDGLGTSVCGVGECQKIVNNCEGGLVQTCVPGQPSSEVCDGKDNDCNGQVDDGLADLQCGIGACAVTVPACKNGAPNTCAPGTPSVEVCNGIDDNCNGSIDDGDPGGGSQCNTGQPGVCAPGILHCIGGMVQCVPNAQPSVEVCDGKDNDCNGMVDDGNPGGGAACNTGKQGVCGVGVTACTGGVVVCNQTNQPSAEVCDGADNNCNGGIDEGNPGGGLVCDTGKKGACAAGTTACQSGSIVCTQNVSPTGEVCDGIDNNCDGNVDEGNPGGGLACTTGQPGVCSAGTTACTNGAIACNQNVQPSAEVCDGKDNDCNGQVDDGNPGGGVSCNTGKLGVCAPGTTACSNGSIVCNQNVQPTGEVCDGKDNDCNGMVDDGNPGGGLACSTGKQGVCAAGTTACSNGSIACNQNVQPSAEVCDGKDNDCNGQVDEGDPGGGVPCNTGKLGVCAAGTTHCQNGQVVCVQNVQPTPETCDGLDNDCNGQVDDGVKTTFYRDADGDGFGNPNVTQQACTAPAGYVTNNTDCNDASASIKPGATEVCDGVDNNCNGQIDEGVKNTYYRDADGDGFGDPTNSTQACTQPAGYVTNNTDCNDTTAAIKPTAPEICDGIDNNCNGMVDEGVKTTFYADADGDGYGNPANSTQACTKPTGYVTNNQDCNDGNNAVHPGATEICNGVDDNCSGAVDEGNPGGGVSCVTGKPGVCSPGTTACSGGALVCNQNVQPSAEVCDGKDNDCDGNIDNGNPGGGASCNTGKPGVCGPGTTACSGGAIVCNQNAQPSPEKCDNQDNDCNGQTDDNAIIADGLPNTCANAGNKTIAVPPGGTADISGYIDPNGDDWFVVNFTGVPGAGGYYHPRVRFISNPSTQFKLKVYSSCGNVAAGCTTNLDQFEMSYPDNPNGCNNTNGGFTCSDGTPKITTFIVQVTRVAGAPFTCSPYTIRADDL